MATIATAGLSSLSQITYPAHSSGRPTAVLPGGFVCLPTSPKYPRSITHQLHIDYPNTILYVDLLGFATGWPVTKLLRMHSDLDPSSSEGVDPNSSWWWRCWPELLRGCWSELHRGCLSELLRGCWHDVDPNSCQTALRTRPKRVLSTCCSVAVIWYTRRTHHSGHRSHQSHRGHRGHHSHRSPLSGWVWDFIERRHRLYCWIVVLSP